MRRSRAARWLIAVGALLLACSAGLALAAPNPGREREFGLTVKYLQERQNLDGGFSLVPGRESDPYVTGWVAYALAAASINPQDQKRPGGDDVVTWIAAHMRGFKETTDWERTLLVAVASGIDGRSFGGADLIAPILARQRDDGGVLQYAGGSEPYVNATAFAILAFAELDDDPVLAAAVQKAADWLLSDGVQNDDGSWDWNLDGPGGADMTAAVIEALRAAGRDDTPAERKAFDYLRRVQNDDGGFRQSLEAEISNSMSTAWVLQAMWAAGEDPGCWRRDGDDPLAFLAGMQHADGPDSGGMRYQPGDPAANAWATSQVAPALAGRPLPIAAVPRAEPPRSDQAPAQNPSDAGSGGGEGGIAGTAGGEVLAGGGGRGAPLFSRPQPQSKGRTYGGVRGTRVTRERAHRERSRRLREDRSSERARGATSAAARATGAGDDASGAIGSGGAARRGAGRAQGAGATRDPQVTGTVIGGEAGAPATDGGDGAPAAFGLRGAQAGGEQGPAIAVGIAGALVLCAGAGSLLERRRPRIGRLA